MISGFAEFNTPEVHKIVKLTREELFQMVWNRPTIHVAAELGVSDVMIGKICKRMDIPKPPLGYWRKKETGSQVGRTPLPKATERTVDSVQINRTTVDSDDKHFLPEILSLITKEELLENQIRIHSSLDNAHPHVQRVQDYFSKLDCLQKEVIELPRGEGYLNVRVSVSLVDRALRIADGLIRALEDRGYDVLISKDNWSGEATRIRKDGVEIELSLFEQINKVKRELTDDERKKPPYLIVNTLKPQSTGKLTIKIRSHLSSYQVWRDKLERALEDRLNEVIIGVILMLEPLVSAKRVGLENEKRRLEMRRRAEEERTRIEKFEKDASSWATSNTLREYLKAYRARLIKTYGEVMDGSDEADWLKWAECYVEKIDPLNAIKNEADDSRQLKKGDT